MSLVLLPQSSSHTPAFASTTTDTPPATAKGSTVKNSRVPGQVRRAAHQRTGGVVHHLHHLVRHRLGHQLTDGHAAPLGECIPKIAPSLPLEKRFYSNSH